MKNFLLLLVTTLTIFGCSSVDIPPTMYTLTVSSNPTEGGTINPTSGKYEEGTEVTLRVNTNTHYEFDKWSGSWSGSESPLTITMDGDKNIVGNFKLMDSDGDGVTDDLDTCPDTPNGETVDENGCSNPLYLDSNGVTIKVQEWVKVGDFHELNGIKYEVINNIDKYYKDSNYDLSKTVLKDVNSMAGWFGETSVGTLDHIKKFNQDISHWDTNSVTNMSTLFINNSEFNQDISHWDLSKVTSIMGMFFGPNTKFNRDISNWDVSNVTDMEVVFRYNKSFNQDLSNWNVSKVTNCFKFSEDTPKWTNPKPNFTSCNPD